VLSIALWEVHNQMVLYEGRNAPSPRERELVEWLGFGADQIPEYCEHVLRDALAVQGAQDAHPGDMDVVRAHLAVLLAETGQVERAAHEVQLLSPTPQSASFAHAFDRSYRPSAAARRRAEGDPIELLGGGWAAWRLAWRQSGYSREEDIVRAGGRRVRSWFAVAWATLVLNLLGGLALAFFWFTRRARARFEPHGAPSLSGAELWGLFVRGMFLGYALEYALAFVPWIREAAYLSYGLVLSLPTALLVWHRHAHRDPLGFRAFIGLSGRVGHRRQLALAGLATFVVAWNASSWTSYAVALAGFPGDWSEGVDPMILVGPWCARMVRLLDAIVWVPIGEELVFRGALFGALRSRLSVYTAAGASALLFGVLHFYSLPWLVGVTAFGFVCAVARERTRSLVPGIVAHMLTNLLLVGGEAWIHGEYDA
jgi:membrane protease YdiL (CAAX protease family)